MAGARNDPSVLVHRPCRARRGAPRPGLYEHSGGKDLPRRRDWDDTTYRQWIEWNYARRIELWDANNRVTKEAGGPDCLWVGMNGGTIGGQCESFRDYKRICERTPTRSVRSANGRM